MSSAYTAVGESIGGVQLEAAARVETLGGRAHLPCRLNGVSIVDLCRHPVQEEVPGRSIGIGSQPAPKVGVIEVRERLGPPPAVHVRAQGHGMLGGGLLFIRLGRRPGGAAVPGKLHIPAVGPEGGIQPPDQLHLNASDATFAGGGKAVVIEPVVVTGAVNVGSVSTPVGEGVGGIELKAVPIPYQKPRR